ncbi:hypothetical protein F66182_9884 [Fusarium sp. NRRL 66182]|nr:hypothetical protein F66182_9884 [Fusarium sp. NRRL 66182]
MELDFSHFDIERDFPEERLRSMLDNPGWESRQDVGVYASHASLTQQVHNFYQHSVSETSPMSSVDLDVNRPPRSYASHAEPSPLTMSPRPRM